MATNTLSSSSTVVNSNLTTPFKGSGIYFNEIDLTGITQVVGTFAGGAIITAAKGPAFNVVTSSSYIERTTRFGDLDPLYFSSYYANEFLSQAANYKECRILGMEGYSYADYQTSGETGYVIAYSLPGNTAKVSGSQTPQTITGATKTNPVVVTVANHGYQSGSRVSITGVGGMTQINNNYIISVIDSNNFSLAGVNGTSFGVYTSGGTVTLIDTPLTVAPESVAAILKPRKTTFTGLAAISSVSIAPYTDPVALTTTTTDNNFVVNIVFADTTTMSVICSLRPSSNEYIETVFGLNPLDNTKVGTNVSPLWVEYCNPSLVSRLRATDTPAYYYPGETNYLNSFSTLNLLIGNVGFSTTYSYPSISISNATNADPIVITLGSHYFISGDIVQITGVNGNTAANGTFMLLNVTPTTAQLYNSTGTAPIAGNGGYTSGGAIQLKYSITWQNDVSNFASTVYQTPVTPWIVSDVNANQHYTRLFRIWSVSDGQGANSEIKVQISGIDPSAKNGAGQFNLYVRAFNDLDSSPNILDGYTRCTLNPSDPDYILRKIGDGENFPRQSEWIFIEMNTIDPIAFGALPYGFEGYPNATGGIFPNINMTTSYNLSKPFTSQMLGLANNNVNMYQLLSAEQLDYINSSTIGLGFHLDSNAPTSIFQVCPATLADQGNAAQFVTNPSTNKAMLQFVVAFSGGFDGWNVYNERAFDNPTSQDFVALQAAINAFADNEDINTDFSVLVSPVSFYASDGSVDCLNLDEHTPAIEAISNMVVTRGDALYIPDFAYDVESLPQTAANSIQENGQNIMNSYNAIYFPWLQFQDNTNNIFPWLPPSLIALATIAATATNEAVWQPPAGSLRTVTTNLVRTRRRQKATDREILKASNVNPVTNFPGTGFEITETRTLQSNFSALSFIHNRLLLGYCKKALTQVLRPLLQQLNNNVTDTAFKNAVTPIFQRIKKQNGLANFTVNVNPIDPNNPTQLVGNVVIYPYYPVEQIIVDFILEDQTITVSNNQ